MLDVLLDNNASEEYSLVERTSRMKQPTGSLFWPAATVWLAVGTMLITSSMWLPAQEAPKPPSKAITYPLGDPVAREYLRANRDLLNAQQVQQAWEQRLEQRLRAELAKIKEYTDATAKAQAAVNIMNSLVEAAKAVHKCPTCGFDADALTLVVPNVPEAKTSAKVTK